MLRSRAAEGTSYGGPASSARSAAAHGDARLPGAALRAGLRGFAHCGHSKKPGSSPTSSWVRPPASAERMVGPRIDCMRTCRTEAAAAAAAGTAGGELRRWAMILRTARETRHRRDTKRDLRADPQPAGVNRRQDVVMTPVRQSGGRQSGRSRAPIASLRLLALQAPAGVDPLGVRQVRHQHRRRFGLGEDRVQVECQVGQAVIVVGDH